MEQQLEPLVRPDGFSDADWRRLQQEIQGSIIPRLSRLGFELASLTALIEGPAADRVLEVVGELDELSIALRHLALARRA